MEPQSATREPQGAKREPKGSQVATKMHPKIDLRKRSQKGFQKGSTRIVRGSHFGSNFASKIDEKIDAKIDAEKVMKIDENSLQNGPGIDLNFVTFRKLVS